jgi:hypothetical protein
MAIAKLSSWLDFRDELDRATKGLGYDCTSYAPVQKRSVPRIIGTLHNFGGHKNSAKEAAAQENIMSTIDEFP